MSDIRVPSRILSEIASERYRQHEKWGEQNHPDGVSLSPMTLDDENWYRTRCQEMFAANSGTWRDILLEEVYEALATPDSTLLREELIQVAAVAVAWIEAIDRRNG